MNLYVCIYVYIINICSETLATHPSPGYPHSRNRSAFGKLQCSRKLHLDVAGSKGTVSAFRIVMRALVPGTWLPFKAARMASDE